MTKTVNCYEPWLKSWPVDELEPVPKCPVCGESSRNLLHADLIDNVFHVAPGKWVLWSCVCCRSAYLDPRPTPTTIHRAYANYYTHQATAGKDDYATLSPLRKLRRCLVNGYTNWRYGTQAFPSSALGVLAVYAMPRIRRRLEREYRHLPKCSSSGGRLLDIGCGDGSYLKIAATCGWSVTGLDPDPMAVANAASKSLTVYEGGIEYFDGQAELFDVITMNHVIEHVYEPLKVLKRCYALLKPGGQLWLETPNINSFGRARFQKNWRGLETPRHLVLFNRDSLNYALRSAGFLPPQDQACLSACFGMYRAGFAMMRGLSPYAAVAMPWSLKLHASAAAVLEIFFPSRREFLTVIAGKVEK